MPEEQRPEPYPIDVMGLQKGDVIDIPTLERIVEAKEGTETYRLGILSLRAWIMKERSSRACPVIVATLAGALKVLTDPEAAEYTAQMHRQRTRQMTVNHLRALDVDVSKLSAEQRVRHESALNAQGRELQALLAERRRLALEPTRRPTPGLPVVTGTN